jgi:hypothetical protein
MAAGFYIKVYGESYVSLFLARMAQVSTHLFNASSGGNYNSAVIL